ncbi:MAG: hypothetical protein WAQ24_02225 [Candidatus Saccharimonadales bacterium]
MTKQKPDSIKRWQRLKKWPILDSKKGLVICALVLFLTPIMGYYLYEHVAVQFERRNFTRTQQDIKKLATMINARYPSQKSGGNASCHRASAKFRAGSIFCNIEQTLTYSISDRQAAVSNTDKITAFMRENTRMEKNLGLESYDSTLIGAWYLEPKDMQCVVTFAYYDDKASLVRFPGESLKQNSLIVSLSCGNDAREFYFPEEN